MMKHLRTRVVLLCGTGLLLLLVLLAMRLATPAPSGPSTAARKESSPTEVDQPSSRPPLNVVMLLDLSNRVSTTKHPGQREHDLALIQQTCAMFENQARSQLYMGSRDCLTIGVAPQWRSDEATMFEIGDRLRIDMRKGITRPDFEHQRRELLQSVSKLYDDASLASEYDGADIWSFIGRDLPTLLYSDPPPSGVHNVLIILTDGYIDFAPSAQQGRPIQAGRTSFMSVSKYRGVDGLKTFSAQNAGMIPNGDLSKWDVLVLEMKERQPDDLKVVKAYWNKWLAEMHCQHWDLEPSTPSVDLSASLLRGFVEAAERRQVQDMAAR